MDGRYKVTFYNIIETDSGCALARNDGSVAPLYELLEILTMVKPFYDTVSDRAILEHNNKVDPRYQDNGNYPHDRHKSNIKGFVYVLKAGPYYKIGMSKNVDARIKALATLPPFDLTLVHLIETLDMYALESELHLKFASKRKNGEWFMLSKEDVKWLRTEYPSGTNEQKNDFS